MKIFWLTSNVQNKQSLQTERNGDAVQLNWHWIETRQIDTTVTQLRRQKGMNPDSKNVDLITSQSWLKPPLNTPSIQAYAQTIVDASINYPLTPDHHIIYVKNMKLVKYFTFRFQRCRSLLQTPWNLQVYWHTECTLMELRMLLPIKHVVSYQYTNTFRSLYLLWQTLIDVNSQCRQPDALLQIELPMTWATND